MKRREFVSLIGVGSLFPLELPGQVAKGPYITKVISSSGQRIPVIGMGTSRTFNLGSSARLRDARCEVLAKFFAIGGQLIDSSPMYGSSEEVVSHPGVTFAIPATSKVDHMIENMGAVVSKLPDQKMRVEMLNYLMSL